MAAQRGVWIAAGFGVDWAAMMRRGMWWLGLVTVLGGCGARTLIANDEKEQNRLGPGDGGVDQLEVLPERPSRRDTTVEPPAPDVTPIPNPPAPPVTTPTPVIDTPAPPVSSAPPPLTTEVPVVMPPTAVPEPPPTVPTAEPPVAPTTPTAVPPTPTAPTTPTPDPTVPTVPTTPTTPTPDPIPPMTTTGECGMPADLGSDTGLVATGTNRGSGDQVSPSCASEGGAEVVFTWTAPEAGDYLIDTFGSDYDTTLVLYDDTACRSEVLCNDDTNGGVQSLLSLAAQAGQVFTLALDAYSADSEGNYQLSVEWV
jgi:hypothetical protein